MSFFSTMGVGSSVARQEHDQQGNPDDTNTTTPTSHKDDDTNTTTTTTRHKEKRTGSMNLRSYSKLSSITERMVETHRYTQRLVVTCPGCEPHWQDDHPEVVMLLAQLGQLPALEELVLNCVGLLEVAFPISLLTVILEACPNLQSLQLDDVACCISSSHPNDEVLALARAISKQATTGSLREFRFYGGVTHIQNPDNSDLLDPLWKALANLQSVNLEAVEDGLLGGIAPSTLQCLAQSTTLEKLHLRGFVLNDTCLKHLGLGLNSSSTVLTDLSLDLLTGGSLQLAQALGATTTLQQVDLTLTYLWTNASFLKALAKALSHKNSSLLAIKIGTCAVFDDATAAAFVEMLQHHNHVLQELQLGRYRGIWKPHLEYYLKLNRQNRGYFHANFTRLTKHQWIEDGLIPVRDDLEGIFYFLQMNPILLSG